MPVSATGLEEGLVPATGSPAVRIASEAATSRAVGAGTEMLSAAVPGVPRDTADRVRGPAAAVEPPAWALVVEEVCVAAEAAVDAGKEVRCA